MFFKISVNSGGPMNEDKQQVCLKNKICRFLLNKERNTGLERQEGEWTMI